jgi:hypothetical protein
MEIVVGLSSGIFARPAWRDASPGGPSVIVDAIFAVTIGARPIGRDRRSLSLGYVGGATLATLARTWDETNIHNGQAPVK